MSGQSKSSAPQKGVSPALIVRKENYILAMIEKLLSYTSQLIIPAHS